MNNSELFKHQCSVRYLCKLRKEMGLNKFRVYVSSDQIQKLWNKLADDFTYQWMKGNRGNHGDWR
jgi:hypothetical protein